MVIDPNNRLPSAGSTTARNRSTSGVDHGALEKKSNTEEKPSAPAGDSVMLSPEAQALKRLEAHIAASPEIDSNRVATIKRAIAEGNFEINVEHIAEKMLQQDSFL